MKTNMYTMKYVKYYNFDSLWHVHILSFLHFNSHIISQKKYALVI